MRIPLRIGAVAVVALAAGHGDAAILKASGSRTTTKAVKTTTAGQRTITCTIDPVNIGAFQLDFQYDADKVELLSVTGVNGYVLTGYDDAPFACGYEGVVENISGFFYPPSHRGHPRAGGLPTGPTDLVQLVFLDLAPERDKGFRTFFADRADFLSGFDADTGRPLIQRGDELFGAQSFAQVLGDPGGTPNGPGTGPAPAPLPGALAMGLVAGAGVLGNASRRHRKA